MICFCLGLFLAIPAAVFGQTNYYAGSGVEYPIIGSLPGDQIYPDVALNTNGGYVVWQDNITDPVGEGISEMRIEGDLSVSGDAVQVNTATTNNQGNAHVALLQNGGAAFVWQGGPDNMQHIYARFLNVSNIWLNNTNVWVSTFTSSFQTAPAVAALNNGNVIVVWASYDQASPSSLFDVYGQMLSSNGTAIGANFLINQSTTYNQRSPAVAALGNGGFVVAWVSETNSVSGTNSVGYGAYPVPLPSVEIMQRLYTVSGSSAIPSTGEMQVNQDLNPCSSPSVAVSADGSYMIAWCANNLTNSNNSWDIYERSFAANGTSGSANLVNSYTSGDQYNPRISVIGEDYLIVWTSLGQDGSREGVFGQFIHEGDAPVGNEFQVNTTSVGQQMEPVVASDGYINFLTVWTSFTFGPNSFDLYAQRYENTAAALLPLPAPFVGVPFILSKGVYQPELAVSWPPVQGLSVVNYQVRVDGVTNIVVATNQWVMTTNPVTGLPLGANSTHSFAVTYTIASGFTAPFSPFSSGTTWSGQNWGGIPYEWMEEWGFPVYQGNALTNFWPSANAQVASGGPTFLQVFLMGGNPFNPSTWLQTTLTRTDKGLYLNWNTQPGLTYQVMVTTDFTSWSNYGAPRFASGTNDSVFVGSGPVGYYRVQLLWQ